MRRKSDLVYYNHIFSLGKKKKKEREKKKRKKGKRNLNRDILCNKTFKVKKWEKILKYMTCIEIIKLESYEDIAAR